MTDYDDAKLDNFVPRFSLLANVKVTTVVLIGVWMIFLPVALFAFATMLTYWVPTTNLFASLIASILPLLVLVLSTAILMRTTRQFQLQTSNRLRVAQTLPAPSDSGKHSETPPGQSALIERTEPL